MLLLLLLFVVDIVIIYLCCCVIIFVVVVVRICDEFHSHNFNICIFKYLSGMLTSPVTSYLPIISDVSPSFAVPNVVGSIIESVENENKEEEVRCLICLENTNETSTNMVYLHHFIQNEPFQLRVASNTTCLVCVKCLKTYQHFSRR